MSTLRNAVGFCCYLALTLSPVLAAERTLLDPDWNEPGIAKAKAAMDSQRAARPADTKTEMRTFRAVYAARDGALRLHSLFRPREAIP